MVTTNPASSTMVGSVRWFNTEKGFGFITASNGQEIFVRQLSVKGDTPLSRGRRVRFRVVTQREGLVAHDVQPL